MKEDIFRLDIILKNAIFDDFHQKSNQNRLIFTKSCFNSTIIIMLAFGKYL